MYSEGLVHSSREPRGRPVIVDMMGRAKMEDRHIWTLKLALICDVWGLLGQFSEP